MTRFDAQIEETRRELGVTARQAMLLEFAAMAGWAHVGRNQRAEAFAYIGAAHARGDLSGAEMRQCLGAVR